MMKKMLVNMLRSSINSSVTELPAANPSAATRPPEPPWQCQLSQKRPSTPDPEHLPATKVSWLNITKLSPSQAAAARTFSPPFFKSRF